jgi:hypothetical protein
MFVPVEAPDWWPAGSCPLGGGSKTDPEFFPWEVSSGVSRANAGSLARASATGTAGRPKINGFGPTTGRYPFDAEIRGAETTATNKMYPAGRITSV